MGVAEMLGKQVNDLSKVRMKKLQGRGRVELVASKDLVTVIFDGTPPGADRYRVILTFGL
jgi:hypothetical protein